jgi:hypothetical protein
VLWAWVGRREAVECSLPVLGTWLQPPHSRESGWDGLSFHGNHPSEVPRACPLDPERSIVMCVVVGWWWAGKGAAARCVW